MKKLSCIVAVLILLSLFTVNCFADEVVYTESKDVYGTFIPASIIDAEFPDNVFVGKEDGDYYDVITDKNVNVSIINPYDEGIAGFAVMPITDKESDTYKFIAGKLPEDTATAAPFYMFYIGADGKAIDLYDGTLVNISGLESQYVVGVSPNGKITTPTYTYEDGTISFRADGSKYYVLCERKVVTPAPTPTPEQKPESVVPNTGDNQNINVWFMTLTISAALIALVTVIKRKEA